MKLFGLPFAAVAVLCAAPSGASAACNALAVCTCTATTTGVNFGSYSMLASAPTDAVGTVTVTCVLTVALTGSFTVDLSTGLSGAYIARSLKNGSASLAYNLYTAATRTSVWGDGTGGSQRVIGSISALLASVQTLNVYGRMPAGQNAPSGSYADAVVITVTY